MLKELAQLDTNLRKAGYVLLVVVLGGALLALVLYPFNLTSLVLVYVWAVNLPAAWFLAQAARLQGRSAWLTGFISIIPVMALLQFFVLCPGSPRIQRDSWK